MAAQYAYGMRTLCHRPAAVLVLCCCFALLKILGVCVIGWYALQRVRN